MGTYYRITATGVPAGVVRRTMEEQASAAMAKVDRQMSTYRKDSDLSRFNESPPGIWVAMPEDLVGVVEEASMVSHMTGGAFDVTVGALVDLWGFGPGRTRRFPDDATVAQVRATVGYGRLAFRREPPALRKESGALHVDLSGIAKGFAVDEVCRALDRLGVRGYLVDIGGDLRVHGDSPSGAAWRIGVEQPHPGAPEVRRVLSLTDVAVATSGNYRNYFDNAGRRYSHIIDPRTGKPVDHGLVSATVVAQTASRADALATAFMVLGPDEGMKLARREAMGVLLIARDGDGFREQYTPQFAGFMSVGEEGTSPSRP